MMTDHERAIKEGHKKYIAGKPLSADELDRRGFSFAADAKRNREMEYPYYE